MNRLKMIRRLSALCLAVTLVGGLTACGPKSDRPDVTAEGSAIEEETDIVIDAVPEMQKDGSLDDYIDSDTLAYNTDRIQMIFDNIGGIEKDAERSANDLMQTLFETWGFTMIDTISHSPVQHVIFVTDENGFLGKVGYSVEDGMITFTYFKEGTNEDYITMGLREAEGIPDDDEFEDTESVVETDSSDIMGSDDSSGVYEEDNE